MSDARERERLELDLDLVDDALCSLYGPDQADLIMKRIRSALRDSEGREVVAEGWVSERGIGVLNTLGKTEIHPRKRDVYEVPVTLIRRQEAESPEPSNAARLARVDPRYLRHLRRCEDYAVEQGVVERTDWESESDTDTGGEDG